MSKKDNSPKFLLLSLIALIQRVVKKDGKWVEKPLHPNFMQRDSQFCPKCKVYTSRKDLE